MFALQLTTEKNVAAETTDLNDQQKLRAQVEAKNLVIYQAKIEILTQ